MCPETGGIVKILLSGGAGMIGSQFLKRRALLGDSMRLLTRSAASLEKVKGAFPEQVEIAEWDGLAPPGSALACVDAVVHLAGAPVFGGLPTRRRLALLRASRIDSTQGLVRCIEALPQASRPRTLVCASAVGYYGERGEAELDEGSEPGSGFLAELCIDWEGAAARAHRLGLRVVSLRYGVVLARRRGALRMLEPLFRAGLGGKIGSGTQFMPWVHLDDAVALTELALDQPQLSGPLCVTAPGLLRNAEFTRELARVLHRKAVLPLPEWAARRALGPLASELLGSKKVRPKRAESFGYRFRHPDLPGALRAEFD